MRYLLAAALLTACSSSSVPVDASLDANVDAADPTDAAGGLEWFCFSECMPDVACPDTTTARCVPRSGHPTAPCDRCVLCTSAPPFTYTLVCDAAHSPGGAAFSCMSSTGAYVQASCIAPMP